MFRVPHIREREKPLTSDVVLGEREEREGRERGDLGPTVPEDSKADIRLLTPLPVGPVPVVTLTSDGKYETTPRGVVIKTEPDTEKIAQVFDAIPCLEATRLNSLRMFCGYQHIGRCSLDFLNTNNSTGLVSFSTLHLGVIHPIITVGSR